MGDFPVTLTFFVHVAENVAVYNQHLVVLYLGDMRSAVSCTFRCLQAAQPIIYYNNVHNAELTAGYCGGEQEI